MNGLNNRFLSELFIQKKVRCNQEIYSKLYSLIWPCELYFREFLSCSVTDLKIDYAKKIYGHLRAFEDVILPEFTVTNVLSVQLNKLIMSNKGYIPQDHIIHSINLYILGIYLFFNFPLFNKRILAQDSSPKTLCSKITSFVEKWKIFSLYHDVGYYFESNIDNYGRTPDESMPVLCEYKKIYAHLIFEYVTRSVARTILCAAIIQRSNRSFSCSTMSFAPSKPWRCKDKDHLENEEVVKILKNYEGATIVEDIQSDEAFSHFVMVLDRQKVLIIIYDKDEYPIGYVERFGNNVDNFYVVKDSSLDKPDMYCSENSDSLFEKIPSDCTLRYCINNASDVVYAHLPVEYINFAKHYYGNLPESLQMKLSFATTDSQINQCYYDIYLWLIEKAGGYLCSDQVIPEYEIYRQSMKQYYESAINDCLANHIRNMIMNADCIEISKIENVLQTVAKSIKDKETLTKLTGEIHKMAEQNYSIEEGVSHDMITLYAQTYDQVMKDFLDADTRISMHGGICLAERLEMLHFMHINEENEIEIEIFKHGDQDFEIDLYAQIKMCAEKLKIDFSKLTTYSTSYTKSDHGLISAGLLFQATVFSHYLAEYSAKHDNLKTAWHGLAGYQFLSSGDCIKGYAEVIFSILLHNIYTQKSNQVYGINYRHSLDNDAFSFFCAFCDTFQKWHRPKQIDYGKAGLPHKHFLSDEFDIYLTEDKICLKCNMQDANYIRNSLQEENTFLPGVAHLVHITEY